MISSPLIKFRLTNQQITGTEFKKPAELVKWFGAVQAQDYAQAKWAIGTRLPDITDADIDIAFNKGKILRTHILRPTWHFISPDDIGWMLKLTAPRIDAACKGIYRRLELDKKIFSKSNRILEKALETGNNLTRAELASLFKREKIATEGLRLVFLLFHAELNGIICSGPKIGNQFTYTSLELRSKKTKKYSDRNEALAELTRRYFTSHGPATIQDFSWWSGLSITDAKLGVEMINSLKLKELTVDKKKYWMTIKGSNVLLKDFSMIKLLPAFDEYTVAYADRSAVLNSTHSQRSGKGIFKPLIISDGKIIGTWNRRFKKDRLIIDLDPFDKLSRAQKSALEIEMKRYADFLEMKM